jgi:membrane-associated phospholipid phosphatase
MTLIEAVQGGVSVDASPRREPRHAHLDPPTSPSRLLLEPLRPFLLVAGLFLTLAVAAFANGGSVLLHIDEPIGRFVVEHRTAWLDRVVRNISFFGSTRMVLVGGLALAIVAWPKCRMVAALIVAATLTRPPLEFLLKLAVSRDRPEIDQMVHGAGYSFPSGHPMAAATLWLMVPIVVSLYTSSHRIWVASAVGSLTAVALIGASRVYLGVHWPIDVFAGGLAAAMLLAGLDLVFRRLHAPRACGGTRRAMA